MGQNSAYSPLLVLCIPPLWQLHYCFLLAACFSLGILSSPSYNLNTPACNASGSKTFHPKLCEASSVVEQRTGNKLPLLYNTTLTLTLSANARNNRLLKMVILVVRLCANLKTGTLSCERRDVFSSKKTIPGSTLFNTLVSVHRWLSLFNRKCLSHLPLPHSCSSVDHTHIVPVDVMRSIPFKDMLSNGRFLRMIEPNSIPVLLRSYFPELSSSPPRTRPDRSRILLNTQHPFVFHSAVCPSVTLYKPLRVWGW